VFTRDMIDTVVGADDGVDHVTGEHAV